MLPRRQPVNVPPDELDTLYHQDRTRRNRRVQPPIPPTLPMQNRRRRQRV